MNKKQRILFSIFAFLMIPATPAIAQIGPDLRPPGLDADHPISSYKKTGGTSRLVDHSWELNTGDVVFSAAKKRQLISEAPSTIHVITDAEIASHGWRTLAEILRHVPGVQTLTTKSQFQSVMIRGLVGTEDNNSRILWLQNGVPMNDVRDSGIWLDETYPVEMIKRIEVVLGPGSALYGSGAFQGVVNIFTKDPADINPYGEYRLAIQNNLTFKASAIAAYTSEDGKFGILGHVAGNTTQGPGLIGDYVYTNYAMDQAASNVASNKQPTDARYENIASSSQKSWYNLNFKLHYDDFKWNFGFTDIYAGGDGSEIVPNIAYDQTTAFETPGIHNTVDTSVPYRFDRREFYTDFLYDKSFTEDISFTAVLSYRYNYYHHQNYGAYASNGNTTTIPVVNADGTTEYRTISYDTDIRTHQHKLYGLAQVNWQIYSENQLIAGLVLEYQHLTSNDLMSGKNNRGTFDDYGARFIDAHKLGQLTPSIFIQDEQRFWNNRIILTAGARFDAYRIYRSDTLDPDYAPSWRFAFLAKWTDWMTMRLSYGYSFKEPSLFQLYANTYDYYGLPLLDPETLHNIELSFLFTPTYFLKIRLDGFVTLMDKLIIMQFDTQSDDENFLGINGYYTPEQQGGAQIYGFELSADAIIGNNWKIYSHYNFLYSHRDFNTNISVVTTSTGDNIVPDDAMHRFKLGATYTDDRVNADLALFLVGGSPNSFDSRTQSTWQTPFYAILQPEITIALPANLGLGLQGSYAFSKGMTKSPTYRYYYEKQGVPVSRYSFMLSLNYPFRNDK